MEMSAMAVTNYKDGACRQAPTASAPKETPHIELTLKGHEEWVSGVAFIPGTRLLVTSSSDKSLRVWDIDTGQQVGKPLWGHNDAVWTVAASPDGCWIVSGAWNGSIIVWEVTTNESVPVSFKGHEDIVESVVFAPNSEAFASASTDNTVCVWKRETGEIILGPLRVGDWANSVSYSPDGSKLAAGTDRQIIIWNAENGEELLKIEQSAWRVAFTPDGLRLLSGAWKDIRISDAVTGDIIKQFDVHTQPFHSLAIAPNGIKFATTSTDKTTRFFDLATLEPIGEPLEHPDTVHSVAFSEDSQLIATSCSDNLARTWTVPQSESEKESQQAAQKVLKQNTIPGPKPRRERAGLPQGFFDDFDTRSTPRRNNRTAPTSSRIKKIMNRLLLRSSAPQDHTLRPRRIHVMDVFATRGKYREKAFGAATTSSSPTSSHF
ncbi:WD40-repeat-containing domain protein [Suillus ampliporus]|nr:WD40-repeat-containing domain protein [Suillus ampliporus]